MLVGCPCFTLHTDLFITSTFIMNMVSIPGAVIEGFPRFPEIAFSAPEDWEEISIQSAIVL